jgi:hypothetical protein
MVGRSRGPHRVQIPRLHRLDNLGTYGEWRNRRLCMNNSMWCWADYGEGAEWTRFFLSRSNEQSTNF